MPKAVIRLEDVWKIYKMDEVEVYALRGINLEIKESEFLAVLGKSGSGKSTILNMVGCLDLPTKGKIYLDGKDVSVLDENELARIRGRKIGFVFQTFNLISSLTALENVMLPMVFQGIDKYIRIEKAKKVLDIVGLKERMNHRPSELSGGERQRVAIARALINDPEIILADEPTGNLDSKTGNDILKILLELNKKHKKTVVIITHDKSLASYVERVVQLADGQIVKGQLKKEMA
ncbi:ABC transporter ATP-binding protein [Candidatus Woesearchaeota archaeon]|nr:ABC transporter ATP-binding protein [Candidatus Woesearchaeota archaeon]